MRKVKSSAVLISLVLFLLTAVFGEMVNCPDTENQVLNQDSNILQDGVQLAARFLKGWAFGDI